ncbi:MAG: hypothetical protein ACJAVV_000619 [Alphaproteobacteria bacterium]|jgi:hypothetical protein
MLFDQQNCIFTFMTYNNLIRLCFLLKKIKQNFTSKRHIVSMSIQSRNYVGYSFKINEHAIEIEF